ncbi:MAG: GGDEF domain-containing protein [Firmicutes bacterium]|nr:GGDEF domain-containing protein [Bacillota bacterium]
MYYASVGLLAVIHHVIINYDILKNGGKRDVSAPSYHYSHFLQALLVFYFADLTWGFAADSGHRMIAYADTCLFFGFMALSVLLWTKYVVVFLGKKGVRANIFMGAGWLIFGFVIFHLIINVRTAAIFTFTADMEYVTGIGRNIMLYAQVLMYLSITVYSLIVSVKSEGKDKIHYMAVCTSGGVMAVFIVLQLMDAFAPFYTMGCLIANTLMHIFVEEDDKRDREKLTEEVQHEKELYSQITSGLAKDYDAIYYINIETGQYMELSAKEDFKSDNIPQKGRDFYADSISNVIGYVHHDDREFARTMLSQKSIKENFASRPSYTYKYRVVLGDEARYFNFQCVLSEDREHFLFCIKDINDTITAETAMRETQEKSITFSQIAESLASNYDVIYYVDIETEHYVGYTTKDIYGELAVEEHGDDFFADAKKNAELIIHPQDRDRMLTVMDRDYLLTALEGKKQFGYQYRLIVDDCIQHTRMLARKTADEKHIIIGVENVETEFKKERKKEKEYLRALNTEKELARRDELTGVRNKTAFAELENSIQADIDGGLDDMKFAIAVCDLNNLKKINDTLGHQAGDEYIQSASRLLCETFDHSPVYRIGGDEFAIFLKDKDYNAREELMASIHSASVANRDRGQGPVIAAGIAEYSTARNESFKDIFDRADRLMYEDKRELKKER